VGKGKKFETFATLKIAHRVDHPKLTKGRLRWSGWMVVQVELCAFFQEGISQAETSISGIDGYSALLRRAV
jgi:hypothetical protein